MIQPGPGRNGDVAVLAVASRSCTHGTNGTNGIRQEPRPVDPCSTFWYVSDPQDPVLSLLRCPECEAALERDDLDPAVVCEAGHRFDLIGGRAPDLARDVVQRNSPGQRAMRFRPLVKVYESVWRPMFTAVAGGTDPDRETSQLLEWMGVGHDATILDVACGPGNTTRRLGVGVPDGAVLGVDLSVPMIEQAIARTPDDSRIGYARVDAHRLPVGDETFDAAHCAAALYLLADPVAVISEIARVLRPGSRFVGMTIVSPVQPAGAIGRRVERLASGITGLRYFGADDLAEMCAAAGLVDFDSRREGAALLFSAVRPGPAAGPGGTEAPRH